MIIYEETYSKEQSAIVIELTYLIPNEQYGYERGKKKEGDLEDIEEE